MEKKKQMIIFFSAIGGVLLILVSVLIIFISSGKKRKNETSENKTSDSSKSNISQTSSSNDDNSETALSSETSQSEGASSGNANNNTTGGIKPQPTTTQANGGGNGDGSVDTPKIIDTTKYNLYTYTQRFWQGNTVYNESVFPMTTSGGGNETIRLLYDIEKIVEVRSSDLKKLYKEGTDYKLQNGRIVIPAGSSIPVNKYDDYYPKSIIPEHTQDKVGGGYLYFAEGDVFHKKQIAVTYTHKSKWGGAVPKSQLSKVPKLQSAIKNKEMLNVVYYGDSIGAGANASSAVGAQPLSPKWTEMFTEALRSKGVSVTDYNSSVGGWVSANGVAEVKPKVNRYSPDLVVIAFGMNDGTHKVSPAEYKKNIKTIMNSVRADLPDCEFLLVASMLPNPEASYFIGNKDHESYPAKLYEIQNETKGVAVANMTEIHKYLMSRKNYRDMTGNNINHPNDFLSRAYAQLLLDTIS